MTGDTSSSSVPSVIYDGSTVLVGPDSSVSGVHVLSGTLEVAGLASGTVVLGSAFYGYPSGYNTPTAFEHVLSGGTEKSASVTAGQLTVDQGGTVNSASVTSSSLNVDGGTVDTLSGSAFSATIDNGGAIHSMVASGARISLENGTVTSGQFSQYTAVILSEDSHLVSSLVESGTSLTMHSGATLEDVTIGNGGSVIFASTGDYSTVTDADLTGLSMSGGVISPGSGTTVSGLHIPANATLSIGPGTAATGTVITSSSESISYGGTDSHFTIGNGGTQTVFECGTSGTAAATSGTILSGGTQIVTDSIVSAITVSSGGLQTLSSGGFAFGTTLNAGANVHVVSGGSFVATDDTALAGNITIDSGASLVFTGPAKLDTGTISGAGMIVQEGNSTLDLTGAGPVLSAFSGTLCITSGTLLVSDPAQLASATVDFMSGYSGTLVVSGASALPGAITDFSPGDKIELASLNWQSGMTTKLVSGNTLDILSPDGSVAGSVSLGSATYSYSTFELTSGSDGGTTLSFAAGSPPGITASRIITEDTSNFVMPSHTTIAFAPGVTVSGITIGQPFPAVVSDTPTEADIYGTVTNAVAGYTILAADVSSDILVDESGATSYSATIDLWSNEIVDAGGNSYNSTIEGGRQSVYGNSYNAMCGSIASNSEISGASQIIYAGGTSYGAHFTSSAFFGMIDDTFAVPSTQTILSGGTAVDTVMDGISIPWVVNPYGSGYYQLNAISTETVESGATAIHTTIDQDGAVYAASGATLNNIVLHGGLLSISTGTIITGGITYTSGTIDVTDLKYAGSGSQQISVGAGNILTITEGDVTRQIALLGDYSGSFSVSAASDGSTRIDYGAPAPCYCRGTLIATETGETPVEDLKTGDRVRTASGALRPIRWIGYRSYDGRFARGNPDLIPVVFTKDSLGNALPRRDLTVSPLHAMFIDGYLIPAHCLLNGTTIRRGETGETLEYFHVELETHDVLLAEGAPSESFVDDHSRNMFHNAASFAELWPDHEPEPAQYCAPRLEDGAALEHIRARLALPEAAGTTNSAVTIHIDAITARSIEGHVTLPHGATEAPALDVFMDETFIGSVLPDRPADKPGDSPTTRRFVFGLPRRISLTGNECFRVRESQTSARAKAA